MSRFGAWADREGMLGEVAEATRLAQDVLFRGETMDPTMVLMTVQAVFLARIANELRDISQHLQIMRTQPPVQRYDL